MPLHKKPHKDKRKFKTARFERKVAQKMREHHRFVKKMAKKGRLTWRKQPEFFVPNSCPDKEEIVQRYLRVREADQSSIARGREEQKKIARGLAEAPKIVYYNRFGEEVNEAGQTKAEVEAELEFYRKRQEELRQKSAAQEEEYSESAEETEGYSAESQSSGESSQE